MNPNCPLSQGNCRAADSTGARWCYIDNALASSCQDKRFSARYHHHIMESIQSSLPHSNLGSLTTPGPMRPVPLLCQSLLPPLPPLQPSLPLWAPPMVSTPPHMGTQHLALDQVDMDQAVMDLVDMDQVDMDLVMDQVDMDQVDLDLDMAVLAVCMAPTWEHCSLMVSFSKLFYLSISTVRLSNFFYN